MRYCHKTAALSYRQTGSTHLGKEFRHEHVVLVMLNILLGHHELRDAAVITNFFTHRTEILRVVLCVFCVKICVGAIP